MPKRTKRQRGKEERTRPTVEPSEHQEQVVLFGRIDWTMPKELADCIFAVPNGGKRDKRTAAKLKAEGVRPGVPDVMVAIARHGWHGLFLELKRARGGTVSPAQKERHAALRAQGFRVAVVLGAERAWRVLCDYLGLDPVTGRYDL